ncbi:MAG: ethanolamine utilization protein EutN [Gemmatimonadetes bacterium]|jgi:microcompartment protein CcmK/EutM|nr:ethanolamine utilization protein EutN [Gemmatimonadota bacterium]
MKRCRVIGQVVTNSKHDVLVRRKIMVVKPVSGGASQLALDSLGAGIGSSVLVSESGIAGSQITGWKNPPARSVIVGIID